MSTESKLFSKFQKKQKSSSLQMSIGDELAKFNKTKDVAQMQIIQSNILTLLQDKKEGLANTDKLIEQYKKLDNPSNKLKDNFWFAVARISPEHTEKVLKEQLIDSKTNHDSSWFEVARMSPEHTEKVLEKSAIKNEDIVANLRKARLAYLAKQLDKKPSLTKRAKEKIEEIIPETFKRGPKR